MNRAPRRSVAEAFPETPGAYVVWAKAGDERPLYVGKAADQSLQQRWHCQHLRPRSGGSALRRNLAVYLGLAEKKLKKGERYPPELEEELTQQLLAFSLQLHPTETAAAASKLEKDLIAELNPILNVTR